MTTEHAGHPFVTVAAIGGGVISGALIAVQAYINGELAVAVDSGVLAAFVSFAVGTALCALALLVARGGRAGLSRLRSAVRDRRMSPWFLFGGVAGAIVVTSQGLVAPVLGVALFTVAVVGGQTVGSLLIDRRGLGTMAPKPLSRWRVLGALLAVGAVLWAVSDRLHGDTPWWLLLLPLVAGLGAAWQQGANGQLRQESGSVLAATFVSFLSGTVVLAVASAVDVALRGAPAGFPADLVLYTGGALGIVFIASGAAIVPLTGVLIFGLATIAGQLAASVLLDLFLPVEGAGLSAATIGGAVLACVAVAIAAIRPPARARPAVTGSTDAPSP